ncbi:transcriptional activator-like protein 3 [Elsinoe australis]|uniref:Transcriptional activator-like protein 3 n=1 Tax=Elsinoe australis TaxID=40998 RepID=A0A4U7B1X1_9PEZI|nr:transcriptional activator-like protein 3 [Elsinoe australis]
MPNRACDVCRRRKQRCIALDDSSLCLTCRTLGIAECTFLEPPPPKRRRDTARTSPTTSQPHSLPTTLSNNTSNGSQGNDHAGPATADSPDYPVHSLLSETLGLEKSRSCELVGANGSHDWMLLGSEVDYQPGPAIGGFPQRPNTSGRKRSCGFQTQIRRVEDDVLFRMVPDNVSPLESKNHVTPDDIENVVKPHGPALVKLFFRIVHPSYPILHKQVFIEKYERTYKEITPHLLGTVYCLAAKWWIYDEELLAEGKLDEEALASLAYRAVQESFLRPRLNSVQAGLLLLQRQLPASNAPTSSAISATFLASLIALGQQMGLHMDCTGWSIPPWEKGLRKRLAWGLVIQDAFAALTQGYHHILNLTDWDVLPLGPSDFSEGIQDEDTQEQPSIEDGKIMFMEMAKLAIIANQVVRELYLPRARRTVTDFYTQVLPVVEPIGRQLADLQKNLAPELRFEFHEPGRLNASACLYLMHHAVSVAVYRRLIWSSQDCGPYTSLGDIDEFISFIRATQLTRARTIVDFFRQLQSHHMEAFWIAAAGNCATMLGSFLGLLNVTSRNLAESQELRMLMRDLEWQLRIKAKMGDWVQYALTRLQALGWDKWKNTEPPENMLLQSASLDAYENYVPGVNDFYTA